MIQYICNLLIFIIFTGCWMDSGLNELNKAVSNGDLEKVKSLIKNGTDINGLSWDGDTPLANAIRMNHIGIIRYLLDSGSKLDNYRVVQAIKENKDKEVNKLIDSYTLQLIDVSSEEILNKIKYYESKKAVLLNIWALWCKPCVEEFPMIQSLDYEFNELEVLFISTDFDDQREQVKGFLKDQNVVGESYFKVEKDEIFIDSLLKEWNGTLPFTIVYSKSSGNIVDFWAGKELETRFRSAINKAIRL